MFLGSTVYCEILSPANFSWLFMGLKSIARVAVLNLFHHMTSSYGQHEVFIDSTMLLFHKQFMTVM